MTTDQPTDHAGRPVQACTITDTHGPHLWYDRGPSQNPYYACPGLTPPTPIAVLADVVRERDQLRADVRRLTTERDALQAAADRLSLDAGAARANHRDAYRELQNTATRYRDALTRITAMPAPGTFTPGAAGYLDRAVDIASEALAPDAGKRWTDRLHQLERERNHYRAALHAVARPEPELIREIEEYRKDDDPDRQPQDEHDDGEATA